MIELDRGSCDQCIHGGGLPRRERGTTCQNAGMPFMLGQPFQPGATPRQTLEANGAQEYIEEMGEKLTCLERWINPRKNRATNLRAGQPGITRFISASALDAASDKLPDREEDPDKETPPDKNKIW